MLEKLFYTESSWFFTLLRLVLGFVILPHGLQKLCGWFGGYGFPATLDFFESEGIPYVIGFLVIVAESFGAIGLIFGLFTRISAFGIALILLYTGGGQLAIDSWIAEKIK